MSLRASCIFIVLCALVVDQLAQDTRSAEPVGTACTYQGQLKKAGVPVGASVPVTCDFTFTLWDQANAGKQIQKKACGGGDNDLGGCMSDADCKDTAKDGKCVCQDIANDGLCLGEVECKGGPNDRGPCVCDADCEDTLSDGVCAAVPPLPPTEVIVANGLFTANNVNGAGEFGRNAFNGQARWLQISVQCPPDAVPITLPRQPITSTPYALHTRNSFEVANVRDFGVIGDGTTCDSLAIEEAISAASGNARLFFPCGTYLIQSSVDISKPIHISGAARDCVTIKTTIKDINIFSVTAPSVTIETLTLVGAGNCTRNDNGTLVLVVSSGGFLIKDCRFESWGQSAIRLIGNTISGGRDYRIESCQFLNGVGDSEFDQDIGIIDKISDVFITNNTFRANEKNPVCFSVFAASDFENLIISGNRISGPYKRSCISLADEFRDGSVRVHSATISGNIISGCQWQGIKLKSVPRYTITGNRIYDVNSVGEGHGLDGDINVNGGLQGTISANMISGGLVGILMTAIGNPPPLAGSVLEDGFNVSGNMIKSERSDGIQVSTGAKSVVISGNTVLDCGRGGVATFATKQGSTNISVNGNVMRGCRHGYMSLPVASTDPTIRSARLLISNNVIADSTNHGIQISETNDSMIVGNLITNSGTPQAVGRAGIILKNVDGLLISGNVIGNKGGTTQERAIFLGDGTLNVHIINNDLRDNTSTAIYMASRASLVRDNIGPVTEIGKLSGVENVDFTPTDLPGGCVESDKGRLFYSSRANELCFCNGAQWWQVDGEGICDVCGNGIAEPCADGSTCNPEGQCTDRSACEVCDRGGETENCDRDCTWVECGDGLLNATAGEECDDGALNSNTESDACRTDCTLPKCDDGIIDPSNGETCDGTNLGTTGCTSCRAADRKNPCTCCGDCVVQETSGERCDDNFSDECGSCNADCSDLGTGSICGDGRICPETEKCDDGMRCEGGGPCTDDLDCVGIGDDLCRSRDGDGCSSTCQEEGP